MNKELKLVENSSNKEIRDIKLLNVEEAAELLKVKIPTIYSWKHNGKIPFVKIYGRLCFDKQTLINFINSRKVA